MSDNFQKHKETINGIYRRAKEELWTPAFATLVLLLSAILFLSVILNLVFFSFGNWFITFIIYLAEIAALLIALSLHQRKIYEAVREKVLEMDSTHPGISEAFEEWRAKVDNSSE